MKNYFAKLKENSKKGFSLVELIIVIAIMAILVGVVAATVIPYMEKSRKSKDQQQLSSITTSAVSAISDADKTVEGFAGEGYSTLIGASAVDEGPAANTADSFTGTVVLTGLYELMNDQNEKNIIDKFKSKAFTGAGDAKDTIKIEYGGQDGLLNPTLAKGQVVTYVGALKTGTAFTADKNLEAISE